MQSLKKTYKFGTGLLLVFCLLWVIPQESYAQSKRKDKYNKLEKKEKKRQKKADRSFKIKSRWSKSKYKSKSGKVTHEAAPVLKNPYNDAPKPRKSYRSKRIQGQRDPASLRTKPLGRMKVIGDIYNKTPDPRKKVKANRYKEYRSKRLQNAPAPRERKFNIKVRKRGPGQEAKYTARFKGPKAPKQYIYNTVPKPRKYVNANRYNDYLTKRRQHAPLPIVGEYSSRFRGGRAPARLHQPYWQNGTLRKRKITWNSLFAGNPINKERKSLKKSNKKLAAFEGRHKIFTREGRRKFYKKRSKAYASYEAPHTIRKKNKDMHPSAAYLNGKKQKSRKAKERSRKWWSRWFKWRKNADQPKHLKEKPRKPKYDTKESEIWYD